MTKALYAGSFDMITNGQLDIVERGAREYESLEVVLAENPGKQRMFTFEESAETMRRCTAHLPNVTVSILRGRYVVDYAVEIGASVMLRGIRNSTDLGFEQVLEIMNATLDSSVETRFMSPRPHLAHVSSSLVKSLIGPEGWQRVVGKLIPNETAKMLVKKKYAWVLERFKKRGATCSEDEFWDLMLARYFEPHRMHHAWPHICEGLDEFALILDKLVDADAVIFAWLLHDAVYAIKNEKELNEHYSSELARELALRFGFGAEFAEKVVLMIRATKDHDSSDPDTMYLIDVDCAVLGYSERRYREYVHGVALEVATEYTPKEFRIGRIGFLLGFLDHHKERIFFTDHFETRLGARARHNATHELERLQIN